MIQLATSFLHSILGKEPVKGGQNARTKLEQ